MATTRRTSPAATMIVSALDVRGIRPLPTVRTIENWTRCGLAPKVSLPLESEIVDYYADFASLAGRGRKLDGILVIMAFRGHYDVIETHIGKTRFMADFEALFPMAAPNIGGMPAWDVEDVRDAASLLIGNSLTPTAQSTGALTRRAVRGIKMNDGSDPAYKLLEAVAILATGHRLGDAPDILAASVEIGEQMMAPIMPESFPVPTYAERAESISYYGKIGRERTIRAMMAASIFDLVYAGRIAYGCYYLTVKQRTPTIPDREIEQMVMMIGAQWWSVFPIWHWRSLAELGNELRDSIGLKKYPIPAR